MHPCLKIDEILAAVAECLTSHTDLLAMAMACRTFYDPTMDVVWHTVSDVCRLLPLLPTGVVATGECWVTGGQYWVCFDLYSSGCTA